MEFIMGHYFACTLALAIVAIACVRFTTCYLGHETADMTLEYIEADFDKIQEAFDGVLSAVSFR